MKKKTFNYNSTFHICKTDVCNKKHLYKCAQVLLCAYLLYLISIQTKITLTINKNDMVILHIERLPTFYAINNYI